MLLRRLPSVEAAPAQADLPTATDATHATALVPARWDNKSSFRLRGTGTPSGGPGVFGEDRIRNLNTHEADHLSSSSLGTHSSSAGNLTERHTQATAPTSAGSVPRPSPRETEPGTRWFRSRKGGRDPVDAYSSSIARAAGAEAVRNQTNRPEGRQSPESQVQHPRRRLARVHRLVIQTIDDDRLRKRKMVRALFWGQAKRRPIPILGYTWGRSAFRGWQLQRARAPTGSSLVGLRGPGTKLLRKRLRSLLDAKTHPAFAHFEL